MKEEGYALTHRKRMSKKTHSRIIPTWWDKHNQAVGLLCWGIVGLFISMGIILVYKGVH